MSGRTAPPNHRYGLLRQVGAIGIDDDLTVFYANGICLDTYLRIYETPPCQQIELPEVPRAADNFAITDEIKIRLVSCRRCISNDTPAHPPGAERPRLMGAKVAKGVVRPIDVEHADPRPATERYNNPSCPGGEFSNRADNDATRIEGL